MVVELGDGVHRIFGHDSFCGVRRTMDAVLDVSRGERSSTMIPSQPATNSAPQTPPPTEQPIPRYDYASGKVEYVLRGLFYDSREEALACNKQRMPREFAPGDCPM